MLIININYIGGITVIKNSTKRVYIVNNFKSDKIEQAIFILKSDCIISPKTNDELALEAQKIIDEYVMKMEKNRHKPDSKKKKSFFSSFLFIISLLSVFGVVSYFVLMALTKIL